MKYFGRVVRDLKRTAEKRAYKAAQVIRTTIIIGMASPKHGRRYPVPGTKRYYTASAAGEYPAIRLGQLRSEIQVVGQVGFRGAHGIVGTNVKHGLYLEGTASKPGIRPWLSKGVNEASPEVEKIVKEKWF